MAEMVKIVSQNKKAYHEYFVDEKFEAGLELTGTEVKSLRKGAINLKDSFCRIDDGELLVFGMHISPYEQGNIFNRDPYRTRKLFMHKKEIMRLFGQVGQKGYALVPLPYTSRVNGPKWRSVFAEAKSFTISEMPMQSVPQNEKWNVRLKSKTDNRGA